MEYSEHNKNLQKIVDLITERLDGIGDSAVWFPTVEHGLPQNIEGRSFGGANSSLLLLHCEERGYKLPVFMTFQQAKLQNIHINRGESAFPVFYSDYGVKDIEGNVLSMEEYNLLNDEDKQNCTLFTYTKSYPVFNIDQSNFAELYPEKLEEIKQHFKVSELKDKQGMFTCPVLDKIINENKWFCPLVPDAFGKMCYNSFHNTIHIPWKDQFSNKENYYNALLNEMALSVVSPDFGIEIGSQYDTMYALEEFYSELTTSVTAHALGITACINEKNISYFEAWSKAMRQNPEHMYCILSNVGKASAVILNEVNKLQKQEKTQQPAKEKEAKALKTEQINNELSLN